MNEYWKWNASKVAEKVRSREVSAREVVESSLARLDEVNGRINAVVQLMPEIALDEANRIDGMLAKECDVGCLAGVPVTVKVNTDQAGFATTNGLSIQQNLVTSKDNPVVKNLRDAGAIIIGRTNTPAFSLHWFTRNRLHGHTLNPHNPLITPGGSSGGAAAATASGIGAIGHGTDIAGSIRYPAYACGIHGLRPSFGRVPNVNFSALDRHIGGQIMSVPGPLARSMEDLALGLQAMAQKSAEDPWWTPAPLWLSPQSKRVALISHIPGLNLDTDVISVLHKAGKLLEKEGWVVEETEGPEFDEAAKLQAILWLAEFRRSEAADIRKEDDPDASFVYEQMVRLCPEPDLNEFMDALQRRITLAREWQQFFNQYPIILSPVSADPPFPDLKDLESPAAFDEVFKSMLPMIAPPFMGFPGLSVATGKSDSRVPMGVQLIGARFSEGTLLEAGKSIEAHLPPITPVTPSSSKELKA